MVFCNIMVLGGNTGAQMHVHSSDTCIISCSESESHVRQYAGLPAPGAMNAPSKENNVKASPGINGLQGVNKQVQGNPGRTCDTLTIVFEESSSQSGILFTPSHSHFVNIQGNFDLRPSYFKPDH